MMMQFSKVPQLALLIIVVATIASLATAVVMLSRSENRAGSSSVSQGALGAPLGPATGLQETASVMFRSATVRGTRGGVTLRLFNEQGGSSIETDARAKGRGISSEAYGLWLEPPTNAQGASPILLGTGPAEANQWKSGRSRTQLPFVVTTLEGFTVSVREHLSEPNTGTEQVAATAPAALTATVTKADIS